MCCARREAWAASKASNMQAACSAENRHHLIVLVTIEQVTHLEHDVGVSKSRASLFTFL